MNILLESRAFHPSIGGIETISYQLAKAWQEYDHNVRIVTVTPLGEASEIQNLTIVRQPNRLELYRHVQWCDVFVQSGISLRSLWLPLVVRRPLVTIHHNMLGVEEGLTGLLKYHVSRLCHNIAVSRAVEDSIPAPATVVPNSFQPSLSIERNDANERAGLLFVGRLVQEKGCDVALDALAKLHEEGIPPHLTICGDGPERIPLQRRAQQLGLEASVSFVGWVDRTELSAYYAKAQALLVPSNHEPFGIVALEAIACGCPVVAARTGGLPEAVGPCGLLFEPGDADDLAQKIQRIRQPSMRKRLMMRAPEHLARHDINRIADEYLQVFDEVVARKRT